MNKRRYFATFYISLDRFPKTDINQNVSCHVETVVKLSLKKDTPKIEVTMKPDEESNYTPEEKATYSKIKEYVKEKYGVNVHANSASSDHRFR